MRSTCLCTTSPSHACSPRTSTESSTSRTGTCCCVRLDEWGVASSCSMLDARPACPPSNGSDDRLGLTNSSTMFSASTSTRESSRTRSVDRSCLRATSMSSSAQKPEGHSPRTSTHVGSTASIRRRASGCEAGCCGRRSAVVNARRRTFSSAELLGQRNDDALGAADGEEPIGVLVLVQLAHEFGAMSVQAGEDVLDSFDGEHNAPYAQRVRRCVRLSADRRRGVEFCQLKPALAVRRTHHCDVDSYILEPGDPIHPRPLYSRLALQLQTKLEKERNSGLKIVANDAEGVHPLDRHASQSIRSATVELMNSGDLRPNRRPYAETPREVRAFGSWNMKRKCCSTPSPSSVSTSWKSSTDFQARPCIKLSCQAVGQAWDW